MSALVKVVEKAGVTSKHSRKFFSMLFSVKAQILLVSCVFLYLGKLDQSNWVTVVLTVAGFRTINEVSGMIKSVKNTQTGVNKNAAK